MEYEHFVTNDGTRLAYQTTRPVTVTPKTSSKIASNSLICVLLLHGFSGSSAYFSRNAAALAQHHWVVCPDMRGHGQSSHTIGGYHVARLAVDLHNLVEHLRSANPSTKIFPVGCSIGAAVLWTYIELFTESDFSGFVFVDQAPLQDRNTFGNWGEGLAHFGCYNEATVLEAQKAWASSDSETREATYRDLARSCLGYKYAPKDSDSISDEQSKADEDFFVSISRACNGQWLARLLSDHTRYDHREAIELISKPVLVMAGQRSGCFSVDGMLETQRRAEKNKKGKATSSIFESGHWLFWEEPERFNAEILEFIKQCENEHP